MVSIDLVQVFSVFEESINIWVVEFWVYRLLGESGNEALKAKQVEWRR